MAGDVETSQAFMPVETGLVFFAPAQAEHLQHIIALELASYPPDEAATPEKLAFRLQQASNVFLVALQQPVDGPEQVVGFVCGTQAAADRLTHGSMSSHDPAGHLLAVHSVVVAEALRRRGLAARLLAAYLAYVRATTPGLTRVHLLCKPHLEALYVRVGFQSLGPSDVVHGQDAWTEMALQLTCPNAEEPPPVVHAA